MKGINNYRYIKNKGVAFERLQRERFNITKIDDNTYDIENILIWHPKRGSWQSKVSDATGIGAGSIVRYVKAIKRNMEKRNAIKSNKT